MDEIAAMAGRVQRLERADRRLVALAGALGVGAVALCCLGARRDAAGSIDAEQLTLRDRCGRIRGVLSATPDGARLTFHDSQGRERLRVDCPDGGDSVVELASGDAGTSRRTISLRAGRNGWSTLSFRDGTRERLALGLAYDGEPRLRMYAPEGRSRVSLGSDMSGRAELIIHDGRGDERAVMRVAPGGSPTLTLYDGSGKPAFDAHD